jgi:hypothetical protein
MHKRFGIVGIARGAEKRLDSRETKELWPLSTSPPPSTGISFRGLLVTERNRVIHTKLKASYLFKKFLRFLQAKSSWEYPQIRC